MPLGRRSAQAMNLICTPLLQMLAAYESQRVHLRNSYVLLSHCFLVHALVDCIVIVRT
ncbi:unnamed protein product [Ixodes pacificus]